MIDSAMVMAAGLGTRMRPLTEHRPKPLVEVAGKALIDHSLDRLNDIGIKHVVINVHYLADQIRDHLTLRSNDFSTIISDETDLLLETGGGLVKALPLLKSDPFYCINSDNIWTNFGEDSLVKLANIWDAEIMDALLLVVAKDNAFNHTGAGDFSVKADGQLVRRGVALAAPYIYTGIQIISHRLLRDAPAGPFSTNILWDRAIQEERLFGVVHEGLWFDIGSPHAIAPTEARLGKHG